MLDQPYMTDLIEANSMGHEPHKIHIYSASWGPTDDGKTVDGPRNATMRAIVQGVNEVMSGMSFRYSSNKFNNFCVIRRVVMAWVTSMYGHLVMVAKRTIAIVMVMRLPCGQYRSIVPSTMAKMHIMMKVAVPHWLVHLAMVPKIQILA